MLLIQQENKAVSVVVMHRLFFFSSRQRRQSSQKGNIFTFCSMCAKNHYGCSVLGAYMSEETHPPPEHRPNSFVCTLSECVIYECVILRGSALLSKQTGLNE